METMKYERALTYSLCLSKCKSVNSINQVLQYIQDDQNPIKSLKFMTPVVSLLPNEVC